MGGGGGEGACVYIRVCVWGGVCVYVCVGGEGACVYTCVRGGGGEAAEVGGWVECDCRYQPQLNRTNAKERGGEHKWQVVCSKAQARIVPHGLTKQVCRVVGCGVRQRRCHMCFVGCPDPAAPPACLTTPGLQLVYRFWDWNELPRPPPRLPACLPPPTHPSALTGDVDQRHVGLVRLEEQRVPVAAGWVGAGMGAGRQAGQAGRRARGRQG